MGGCERCGEPDDLNYSCNYCQRGFCSQHRLPENHHCPGLRSATTQGPDFRGILNTDSGVLGKAFGSDDSQDAIAREHHPGMKTYDGDLEPPAPSPGYTPETSSPDVNPDGSIKRQDGETASQESSHESRSRRIGLTIVGLGVLAVSTPFRALLNLPRHLQRFNQWVAALLGSIYGLARTLAPIVLILLGVVFLAGVFIGTGIPAIDDTAQDGADAVGWLLETDRGNREAELEQAIHSEVNGVRAERGLATLEYDADVAAVADNHSQHMAGQDDLNHAGRDETSSRQRLNRAGLSCQQSGENLYMHAGYGTAPNNTAERVVEQWLDSPGHRENLLRRGWAVEGVGVEIESDEVWVTQVFCG